MSKKRYFIDATDDGDWFYIPVEKRDEWNEWQDRGAAGWTQDLIELQPPGFATLIDEIQYLTFTNPE